MRSPHRLITLFALHTLFLFIIPVGLSMPILIVAGPIITANILVAGIVSAITVSALSIAVQIIYPMTMPWEAHLTVGARDSEEDER